MISWAVEYHELEENEWPTQVDLLATLGSGYTFRSVLQPKWHTYAPQSFWLAPPDPPLIGGWVSMGDLIEMHETEAFPTDNLLSALEAVLNPLEAEVLTYGIKDQWLYLLDQCRRASTTWPPSILAFNEWDEILKDLAKELSGEIAFT